MALLQLLQNDDHRQKRFINKTALWFTNYMEKELPRDFITCDDMIKRYGAKKREHE